MKQFYSHVYFIALLLVVPSSYADTLLNVIPIRVEGPKTPYSSGHWPNKATVSIKVCAPDGTACEIIDNIILSTGSTGLRIFKSVLNSSLIQLLAAAIRFGALLPKRR